MKLIKVNGFQAFVVVRWFSTEILHEQHQQSITKQGTWFHVFSLACDELTDVINATRLLLIQEDNAKFEVTEELASVEQL